jgi:hypothetical protein
MVCIYAVRFELQWRSSEPTHWEEETLRVAAGHDAQEAIDKARRHALARHRIDENGNEEHCVGFRLREVHLIAEAQV